MSCGVLVLALSTVKCAIGPLFHTQQHTRRLLYVESVEGYREASGLRVAFRRGDTVTGLRVRPSKIIPLIPPIITELINIQ